MSDFSTHCMLPTYRITKGAIRVMHREALPATPHWISTTSPRHERVCSPAAFYFSPLTFFHLFFSPLPRPSPTTASTSLSISTTTSLDTDEVTVHPAVFRFQSYFDAQATSSSLAPLGRTPTPRQRANRQNSPAAPARHSRFCWALGPTPSLALLAKLVLCRYATSLG
ncbi:hypothetical protein K438DRAFT_1994197 [Mycena galopus ATCC 62051]|nr:hypothetical protein K438DRAFT_1994197 [Mycena galopus ATCC 62051]